MMETRSLIFLLVLACITLISCNDSEIKGEQSSDSAKPKHPFMYLTEDRKSFILENIKSEPMLGIYEKLLTIAEKDFERLAEITESSTLKMHSVMMSTRPSLIFWNGVTVELMHILTALRKEGIGVCYTMDAGPQVKAICLPEHAERVEEAMRSVRGVEDILSTGMGIGACHVEETS